MSPRGRVRKRTRVIITGEVVAPGTLPGRDADRLTVEERRRLALVALGELILKVQRSDEVKDRPRPTVAV